jgi:NAD+ synthase (glutamine-hydrolysing)
MMLVRVAAAALNQTPLDWEGNRSRISACMAAARAAGVSLLCLPEMAITGYGCEDAFLARGVHRTAWEMLIGLLPETRGMVVSLGLPVFHGNAVFNTACLCVDGQLVGLVAKQYLAGDGIHYEPRWFKPWPAQVSTELEVDGGRYPLGDLFFDVGGVRIGFEICEDAWVARRPGGALAGRAVDILLNPSASHFAFGKHEVRKRFVLEGSRAFGTSYVYANLLGNEAGRVIYDGDTLIASGGALLAVGPRFSFDDFTLTTALVDVDGTRMGQARTASFRPQLEAVPGPVRVRTAHVWPELEPASQPLAEAGWETGAHVKEEEFTRAVCLGLFDYLRKSRSRGFVVSLSGGADSAAVACLCAQAMQLAEHELGPERTVARLGLGDLLGSAGSPREMISRLLLTAYQSTQQSGPVTRQAARQVAEAVGAEHLELDVDALVKGYVELVSRALGRPLSWDTDDVALQNIQARTRSPGIWMLANVRRALLLSTSNRSEAAVGYATMDGDTSGGLSPIAGIDKAYLRRYLRWLQTSGPEGLGPIPALEAVTCQVPTAELRPAGCHQTDEDDLMPYPLLDAVERAAIRDKETPLEVFRRMRATFPDIAPEQLRIWVERFFRLFSQNQWKRERYAPSFHLDDENLDPRSWCRFPILSGGFHRELAELRSAVARDQGES